MRVCVLVLFTALTGSYAAVRRCPGGYSPGTEPVRGVYWYRCNYDGKLEKGGCIDPTNSRRIRVGDTYTQNQYVMKCVIEDDYLRIVPYGCSAKGRTFMPGETWNGEKFFYECAKQGDNNHVKVAGCMLDLARLRLRQRRRRKNLIYTCMDENGDGSVSVCAVGCVFNGVEYNIGQQYEDQHYRYECTTKGGWCHNGVMACLDHATERQIQNGESWRAGDSIYKCFQNIEDDADTARIDVEGCWDANRPGYPRKAGEVWVEGDNKVECQIYSDRAERFLTYIIPDNERRVGFSSRSN